MEFLHKKGNEKYITLKEASDLCSYSPDYIGQLIRAGKIEGKQVYSNVAWVTTEAALRAYTESKGKPHKDKADSFVLNDSAIDFARYGMYVAIVFLCFALLVFLYVFSVSLDKKLSSNYLEEAEITAVSYE